MKLLKKLLTILILTGYLSLSLFNIQVITLARLPVDYTDLYQDGDVSNGFVRDNTSATIEVDTQPGNHAYVEYNTSSLPAGIIIDQLNVSFTTHTLNNPGIVDFYIWEMTVQPSTQPDNAGGNQAIYDNITAHMRYLNPQNLQNNVTYTYELNASAIAHLLSHPTWFSLGFTASTINNFIYASEAGIHASYLTVKYHLAGDYQVNFTGMYYENGTYAGPIDVTAVISSGNEVFNVNNLGKTEYYPTLPTLYQWSIGSTTRHIIASGNESLTITYPDDTDYTYGFTVKDYIGEIGTDSVLEAYRVINGSDVLIASELINVPNPAYLNLVYGKVYNLVIRYGDGSTYNWGYFVPGADTSITLIIRNVEFGDQAQILYNQIHVQAERTTGLITVDYLNDHGTTTWANVSIRIRNGAEVANYARNNDSYTINYAGFNETFGYVVTITGLDSFFGVWGRTFILDQTFDFPDAPSFTGIFGNVSQNFIPFILATIAILVFPINMQPIGLIAGASVATITSFIEWSTWDYDMLAFIWLVVIVVNLIAFRGRGS